MLLNQYHDRMIAKKVLLGSLGFVALFLTANFFGDNVNAAPDPTFKPILGGIGNRRPRGMVMRLPSVLRLYDYKNERVTVYPEVRSIGGGLSITFNTERDCKARFCYFGRINAYQSLAAMKSSNPFDYDLISSPMRKPWTRIQPNRVCSIVSRKIIALNNSIKAVAVEHDTCGSASGVTNSVVWEQDKTVFVVQLGLGDINNINVAKSMANEPPTTFPIPY